MISILGAMHALMEMDMRLATVSDVPFPWNFVAGAFGYLLMPAFIVGSIAMLALGFYYTIALRVRFIVHVLPLLAIAAVLAWARQNNVGALPNMVWAILGSVFMFRLIIYAYDVRMSRKKESLTDMWGWGLLSLKMVLEKCPSIPIAVMPASYYLTETDFPAMFDGREHRVVLFARDVESWDRIRTMDFPPCVERHCDHDLAYYLRETPYMQRLRRETESPEDYVLVVERWDPENPHLKIEMKPASGAPQLQTAWKLFLKSRFWRQKQAIVRLIKPTRLKSEPSEAFRAECEHIINEYEPWAKGLQWRVGDISDPRMHSIETFGSVIARSKLVISTRMHVGILAGMLGKKTYMRTGAFGKLSGGYAMSMYDWPNVKLFGGGGVVESDTRE